MKYLHQKRQSNTEGGRLYSGSLLFSLLVSIQWATCLLQLRQAQRPHPCVPDMTQTTPESTRQVMRKTMPTYPSSVQPMKARSCRPKQNANVLPQKKGGPQARRVFPIKTAVFRRDIPTSVQILGNWSFSVKYECPVRHPVPGSLWSHFLRTRRQIYHPCTSPPMCLPESQLLPSW